MFAPLNRALVTGCAGFIGSHLTEALLADGVEVLGIDCFNDNYGRPQKLRNLRVARDWDAFEFVPIDLSRGELEDVVAEAEVIFHLAAEPGVRASWGHYFERYVRNNVIATQHLLDAARKWPTKRFVYASSSSVYGQAEFFPTPESATPQPLSPYGTTKLAAEHLCLLYHANHGVNATALRYFSVYGPRQRPDMAFDIFCRAALLGDSLTVYGDGRQTRDFTFIEDIVHATRLAAEKPAAAGRVYNVGGGSRVSLHNAIALLEEFLGKPLKVDHSGDQLGDVRDTGADTTRTREELGFIPSIPLRSGLERQLESIRASLAHH